MKLLDLKLLEKNQNNLVGIQLPICAKINFLKNISKNITKIKIFGKKNCYVINIIKYIQVKYFITNRIIQFFRLFETKFLKMWQGIYNTIFASYIIDLNYMYKVYMRIYGIAYKVFLEDAPFKISLNLGLTHKITKILPFYIKAKILDKKSRRFLLFGTNRQLINQFAFSLILFKRPNIYTGKGLKLYNYKIRRKKGKKKFA
jgi:large subunit ribosomal protein L6